MREDRRAAKQENPGCGVFNVLLTTRTHGLKLKMNSIRCWTFSTTSESDTSVKSHKVPAI